MSQPLSPQPTQPFGKKQTHPLHAGTSLLLQPRPQVLQTVVSLKNFIVDQTQEKSVSVKQPIDRFQHQKEAEIIGDRWCECPKHNELHPGSQVRVPDIEVSLQRTYTIKNQQPGRNHPDQNGE